MDTNSRRARLPGAANTGDLNRRFVNSRYYFLTDDSIFLFAYN